MAQSVATNVPEQNTQQSVQPQLAQQTQPEQPQTPEEKNLQLLYQKNFFSQSILRERKSISQEKVYFLLPFSKYLV